MDCTRLFSLDESTFAIRGLRRKTIMPPQIAILVFSLGILGLFLLDRDRGPKASMALWIPVIWVGIASSRNVSEWLQHSSSPASAGQYLEGNPIDRNVQIL